VTPGGRWRDGGITEARANVGLRHASLLDVDALPEGDSAWGVRQMIGNVWEWTSSTFYPFPGEGWVGRTMYVCRWEPVGWGWGRGRALLVSAHLSECRSSGFVIDYPYREQSAPWFGTNKVARL
jgi:hypothetical protein